MVGEDGGGPRIGITGLGASDPQWRYQAYGRTSFA